MGDELLVSLGRILPPARVALRRARAIGRRLADRRRRRAAPAGGAVNDPVRLERGATSAAVRVDMSGGSLGSASAHVIRRGANAAVPFHNVAVWREVVLVNDSGANALVGIDSADGGARFAIPLPGEPGFARGLAQVADDVWLVGNQPPVAMHAVDLSALEVVAEYRLGGVEHETVHAIAPAPAAVAASFPATMWIRRSDTAEPGHVEIGLP